MKQKGLIRFFTFILVLACLYELSFTLMTNLVEGDAKEISKGNAVKEKEYLDSMANIGVYNTFIKNFTYAECKEREIKLGLDLKGGMNGIFYSIFNKKIDYSLCCWENLIYFFSLFFGPIS